MLRVLAILVALLIPATAAQAATVTVRPNPDAVEAPGDEPYADEVYFQAAPGETNHVTVAYAGDAHSVTITDPGATIMPTGTCTMVDVHTATCVARAQAANPNLQNTRVELGNGDDTVISTRPEPGPPIGGLNANGGPGNDTLAGSPTEDILDGGSGTDTISGGAGNDSITDGDTDGATNTDSLSGGAGDFDTLSYASHTAPVDIELASSTAGAAGEDDVVSGFESATGGAGPDRIIGTATAANDLEGGPGNDDLEGLGGVTPNGITDTLSGGAGDDRLVGRSEGESFRGGLGTDSFACSFGSDIVYDPAVRELLHRSCESIHFSLAETDSLTLATYPKSLTPTSAGFAFACPSLETRDGEPSACQGKLVLRAVEGAGRKLGAGRIQGDGSTRSFPTLVHLKPRFARLARRRGGVIAAVTIKPGDNLPAVGWRILLRL